jgi:3-hydroxyisobutyrate dehydrogenase/2-hydroxy-3-oxopropionate reductase
MSTVGLAVISEMAGLLDDDSRLLEAPVLGSLSEVENGTLTIFVAGSRPLADRLHPLLSVLGSPRYVGARGSGAAAKLVANLTLVGTMSVLGEAMALAEALALPAETAFTILEATPLSAQAKRRKAAVLSGDYPKRFSLALARKDLGVALDLARETNTPMRLAEICEREMADAIARGWAERDASIFLTLQEERADTVVRLPEKRDPEA